MTTKFILGQKVVVTHTDSIHNGVVAGISLPDGLHYLVVHGDNIWDDFQKREWESENYLSLREGE